MFTFRQKIFITYLFVFLVFIAMMFPFAQRTVKDIVRSAMEDRSIELISKIRMAPNDEALVRKLKEQKALVFFRVSVITNERKLLYDSHTKRLLGPRFSQEYVVSHPEVLQALRNEDGKWRGYHEEYSEILSQEFAYFAKAFDFHGKKYVLRTAFPLDYVEELTADFEFGFLGSAIAVLLLFSTMTWFIINYLTRPIQQIIKAVRPYQEGEVMTVPEIRLKPENRSDEFGQLASTLNSLSVKIRKQIETLTRERNEKLATLESLVEGVISVDENMIIRFANTMSLKLLQLERKDVLDQPVQVLKHEPSIHLLERCQNEGAVLIETIEFKRMGEKLWLDLVAAPKKDAGGAILVIQDKTEHYRIIEMRKDFVANASHELKTPITIIRGFAETLHDNPDLPPETFSEITGKIVNNCMKMNFLIKDLLTLTDIEHIPESRLIECDIHDLALTAKDTVQDAYPNAAITVLTAKEEDYYLLADPNLMDLALTNLVENAAKYSDAPPEIKIILEQDEEWMRIAIQDNGVGIPEEELDNIFQRFYRVNKSRASAGGSGLGLSIVETIIAKHYGKITVESEEGKGSTFTLHLPLNYEAAREKRPNGR